MSNGTQISSSLGASVGAWLRVPGTKVVLAIAVSEATTFTVADAKAEPVGAFDAIAEASAPLETAAVNCDAKVPT